LLFAAIAVIETETSFAASKNNADAKTWEKT